MTKQEFQNWTECCSSDGATGSNLMAAGMPKWGYAQRNGCWHIRT